MGNLLRKVWKGDSIPPTNYIWVRNEGGEDAAYKYDPVSGEWLADTGWSENEGTGGNVTVEDNLTSTSTTNALSANQGRVLDEKIRTKVDTNDIYTKTESDSTFAKISNLPSRVAGSNDTSLGSVTFTPTVGNLAIGGKNLANGNNTSFSSIVFTGATNTAAGLLVATDYVKLQALVENAVVYTFESDGTPIISLKNGTKIASRPEDGGTSHEILGINTYTDGSGKFDQFEVGSQEALYNINILYDVRTEGHATADVYQNGSSTKETFAYLSDITAAVLTAQSTLRTELATKSDLSSLEARVVALEEA